MAVKPPLVRDEINEESKALTAEGFSCTDCYWLSQPWRKPREKQEQSCRERGYGTILCSAFSDVRRHFHCGECQYLHGKDPEDGATCAIDHERKEGDFACDSFFPKNTSEDLAFDSEAKPIAHNGNIVDVFKYVDGPKTPVLLRYGDTGLLVEPLYDPKTDKLGFRVIPVSLYNEHLLLTPNTEVAMARATGLLKLQSVEQFFSNETVTVYPTKPSARDRIKASDRTTASKAVIKFLKKATINNTLKYIPKRLLDIFANSSSELGSVKNAVSMAANHALLIYDKEIGGGLTQDQKRVYKQGLVDAYREGLLQME